MLPLTSFLYGAFLLANGDLQNGMMLWKIKHRFLNAFEYWSCLCELACMPYVLLKVQFTGKVTFCYRCTFFCLLENCLKSSLRCVFFNTSSLNAFWDAV